MTIHSKELSGRELAELKRALHRVVDAVIDLTDILDAGTDCAAAWATFDRNVAATLSVLRDARKAV